MQNDLFVAWIPEFENRIMDEKGVGGDVPGIGLETLAYGKSRRQQTRVQNSHEGQRESRNLGQKSGEMGLLSKRGVL